MENGIIIFVIALVIVSLVWTFTKARKILELWAKENNYHILSSQIRWFNRGPFFWTTSRNQIVYYVTVRTLEGIIKKGWVRCGSWWLGIFADKAEVRWDE